MSSLDNGIPRIYKNEIVVAKSGGDFTTLEAALALAGARDLITIMPGIYVENNPLACVANTTIFAHGGRTTTRIQAANANQDLFTAADALTFVGLSMAGVSGAGWVMQINAAYSILFNDCAMFQCQQGVKVNHANASVGLSSMFLLAIAPVTMAVGVQNNAGNLTMHGLRILTGSQITTLLKLDGVNAITTIEHSTSFESGITTIVFADNDARSVFSACSFVGMYDCAVLQGGSDTRFVATSIFLAQRDAVRIENVGADTNFVGQGLTVESSGRYDINILSATAIVSGYGQASIDQMNFVAGAHFTASFIDLKEDDEGLNIIGELHVGTPEMGTESVFGEGDSYTRGMLVYTYNPAGAVWTDVSVAARSASGSTFTFPALAADSAIYVASSLYDTDYLHHDGIKVSVVTAFVPGGGSIVAEYWDGGAWVAIDHMSTLSGAPYTQYAKEIFERTGSEQIRLPIAFIASWVKNDPMAIGTNYLWIRYRITALVTTVPVFQQFKLHTDRFEVNADGASEYFGHARYPKDLIVHLGLNEPVTGSSPGNAAVAFSSTTTLTLTRNQFSDNQIHSFGEVVAIPVGLDTSIPLTLEVGWYADTINAGNVEMTCHYAQLEFGDLWDGTKSELNTAVIEAVGAGTRYVSRKTSFSLDVSDLVPGELIVFKTQRDATGPNDPPDTLAGNVIIGTTRMFGYFWRP